MMTIFIILQGSAFMLKMSENGDYLTKNDTVHKMLIILLKLLLF